MQERQTIKVDNSSTAVRKLDELQTGDVVAKHVKCPKDTLLVRRGVELDTATIQALAKRGVTEVIVEEIPDRIGTGEIVVGNNGDVMVTGSRGKVLDRTSGRHGDPRVRVDVAHMAERLQLGFERSVGNALMDQMHEIMQEYLTDRIVSRYES